ncbi:hypothetical protein BDA99DRAFT_517563 [Phascolomyces articulosus]|uniref:Uncharacterized protein n=1 Tax=Phascolomyces articulosus TaxID=60185 RepID=A0AAD5JVL9_9FUNG|nr:hypothetical protein BDA99DRAFT_517563 [Phascolomyces articulosus]
MAWHFVWQDIPLMGTMHQISYLLNNFIYCFPIAHVHLQVCFFSSLLLIHFYTFYRFEQSIILISYLYISHSKSCFKTRQSLMPFSKNYCIMYHCSLEIWIHTLPYREQP